MSLARLALLALPLSFFGCAVNADAGEDDHAASSEAAAKKLDCTAVLCAMPLCALGYELYTPPGQCCPTCRAIKGAKKDCGTTGCGTGEYCAVCRTTSGPANVCLPNGAVC